jgi:hypothetical protein
MVFVFVVLDHGIVMRSDRADGVKAQNEASSD